MSRILFISLIFGLVSVAHADEAPSQEVENKAYWICKNRKEVRTIRVHIAKSGICGTFYSKLGDEKIVASGKSEETCLNVLNNIKGNLEKSSWNCRDITDTKITAALEP